MILQKRIERAFSFLKDKAEASKTDASHEGSFPLEKGDRTAMYISAFLVFVPVVLLMLLVMIGVAAVWIL